MTYETIQISPDVRVRIEPDEDARSPQESWDTVGQIAYRSTRYTLGTEYVSGERLDAIAEGIRNGSLIGLPVYAYVHGSSMIAAGQRLRNGAIVYGNPFSCPWDSGQSGFIYCTREKAVKEWGKKLCTEAVRDKALKYLFGEVEQFSQYLEGDIYGAIVERLEGDEWVEKESCWGFYGSQHAMEEGSVMGSYEHLHGVKEEVAA